VIGQLLAGIILGPSVFWRDLASGPTSDLFAQFVPKMLNAVSELGVKPVTSASSGWKTRWVLAAEMHHLDVDKRQFIAQRFGALHAVWSHLWRGKQLTSTGKLVTTEKLP
jgi:hypothetical protein